MQTAQTTKVGVQFGVDFLFWRHTINVLFSEAIVEDVVSDLFRKCAIGKIIYDNLNEDELPHFWTLYRNDFLAMVYKQETDDQREIEVALY